MHEWPWPWRDVWLPLAVFAVAAVEAIAYGAAPLGAVLVVHFAACAALVARRRWPMVAAPLCFALVLCLSWVGPAIDELASPILMIAVAASSLGRWTPDVRGLAALVPLCALVVATAEHDDGSPVDITDVVFTAAVVFPPYIFGRVMRALADRNALLAEQAESLARLQATVREDAIAAERTRIARELHDVLAHSISAMVVQASAAEEVAPSDPARAAAAMRQVAETGRAALTETGRLLALVRDADGEMGTDPGPELAQLDDLVEQFRRSGLQVAIEVDGDLQPLPAGVGLSAYRIVQEALTNALKYAHDRVVRLGVTRTDSELRIETDNLGRGDSSAGSGLGLVGMAERVSVFGGSLEHGYTADGRFRLRAVLPLEPVDA